MLRDNLVGLIQPMLSSAGANPLALCIAQNESSDDRPPCLENPRLKGAESTLTENAPSPFQAEPRHIGLDVHQATIVVAVTDSTGKLIMESILETEAATILQFFAGLRGTLSVTFEEGTWSVWLYDLLNPHVDKLVVCNPRKNALLKDGNKSDRIDACKLAELLRGNQLKSVYHGETGVRMLRELSRSYADDVISGFQHQADADRFLENLQERLGKFGLELHPDKTRRIEFGRFAEENRRRRGEGKPETFDFLGFTHISGKNRVGRFTVRRKTIRKRMRAKLQEVKQQLRKRMHDPVRQTGQWLKSIMQGHSNYYAVPGNLDSLGVFRDRLIGQWWRTLRRRSQKHPISWTRILALADRWLPQPQVLHPYPAVRFAASHPR